MLTSKLEKMITHLAKKDAELATLKAAHLNRQEQGLSESESLQVENEMLRAKIQNFETKVEVLTEQLLMNYSAENE